MIGRPVTCATDSAAPPRASPSSLESTTPSKPTPSRNASAVVHRVLADHRVDDEQDLVGADRVPDVGGLLHHLGVDAEPAGGVDDDDVVQLGPGELDAVPGHRDRVADAVARLRARTPRRRPARRPPAAGSPRWGAAGRRRPAAACGPAPCSQRRELAGERRLTGTLQTREHDHGRRRLGEARAGGSRRRGCATSSSLTILMTCWAGLSACGDLGAGGALLDLRDERRGRPAAPRRPRAARYGSRARWRRCPPRTGGPCRAGS